MSPHKIEKFSARVLKDVKAEWLSYGGQPHEFPGATPFITVVRLTPSVGRSQHAELQESLRTELEKARTELAEIKARNSELEKTREQGKARTAELGSPAAESADESAGALAADERSSNFRSQVLILRPELAKKIGEKKAIVLQQISFLLSNPKKNGKVLPDGERYIYNTHLAWKDQYFQHWSIATVKRTFQECERDGYIVSKQPDGRSSRRKYYRLSPEGIKLIPSDINEGSICAHGRDQNALHSGSICTLPLTENENTPDNEYSSRPLNVQSKTRELSLAGKRKQGADRDSGTTREGSQLGGDQAYLFGEISRLCGEHETKQNGKMWIRNIKEHPLAVELALEDLKNNLRKVQNAAAYFNECFHGHKADGGKPPGKTRDNRATQTDEQWLAALAKNPTYEGIDVMREFGKMKVWCESNKKNPSRQRFTNWLNRVELPMKSLPAEPYANGRNHF